MTKYGKILPDGSLRFAPDPLRQGTRIIQNATAEQYAKSGYWPVVEDHPAARSGYHEEETAPELETVVPREKGKTAGQYRVHRKWTLVADPEPEVVAKRYSKKNLVLSLANRGKYSDFWAWAEATEAVAGSGLTVAKLIDQSMYLKDGDASFEALVAVARERYGDELVDAVLADAEDTEPIGAE